MSAFPQRDIDLRYLKEQGVARVLDGLIKSLVTTRPGDPIAHMLSCLDAQLQEQKSRSAGGSHARFDDTSASQPPAAGGTTVPKPQLKKSHSKADNRLATMWTLPEIIHSVQVTHCFAEEKDFVDMPMLTDPAEIAADWEELGQQAEEEGTAVTKDKMIAFLATHFGDAGSDIMSCPESLVDWVAEPPYLSKLEGYTDKSGPFVPWLQSLHDLWKVLAKRTPAEVGKFPARYSIFDMKNPMIVPGELFREFYAWDQLPVVVGLLHSGLSGTAAGIIDNMCSLVKRFGHVPNGCRSYYLNRSHPPVLCEMVKVYQDMTGDKSHLGDWFQALELEYKYWIRPSVHEAGGHGVEISKGEDKYVVSRYNAIAKGQPRQEQYRHDVNVVSGDDIDDERADQLCSEIAACCESGWDFSARWMGDGKKLTELNVRSIIPVDLNSILYRMEVDMGVFAASLQNTQQADYYRGQAEDRRKAIEALCWNESAGQWYDYDYREEKQREILCASNFFPMWAGCCSPDQARRAFDVFKGSKLVCAGGVTPTTVYTRQQWDSPNIHPTLQWYMVDALRSLNALQGAADLAQEIALRFVYSTCRGWELDGCMYEMYDSRVLGYRGASGEHEPQKGFAATNGVVIHFTALYADQLRASDFRRRVNADDLEYSQNGALEELKAELNVTKGHLRAIMKYMDSEMSKALKGEPSTMKMKPSYFTKRGATGNESGAFVALEIEGAIARVVRCTLEGGDVKEEVGSKKFDVPTTGTCSDLFAALAIGVHDGLQELNLAAPPTMGFTFTWKVVHHGLNKAVLEQWPVGATIEGGIGEDVVALLEAAFRNKGISSSVSVALTFTVATLAARSFADKLCAASLISEKATRMSYWERVVNIPTVAEQAGTAEEMIIHTDWSNLDADHTVLPRTPFDDAVDRGSANPGKQRYEKMVSGRYLGEICREVFLHLMEKRTIRTIDGMKEKGKFTLSHAQACAMDTTENLDEIKQILNNDFQFATQQAERRHIQRACGFVMKRAGRLVGASLASVVFRRGVAAEATVAIDGTVFETNRVLRTSLEGAVAQIFGCNVGVALQLTQDASGRGAACVMASASV